MRMLALTAMLALVCSSTAMAGGNSKNGNSGTLHVQNNTTIATTGTTRVPARAFILVDPTSQQLQNLQNNPNTTTLNAAGGKIIEAGSSVDITKLRTGTHTVYAGTLAADNSVDSEISTGTITITKGQTTNLTLDSVVGTGGANDTVTIGGATGVSIVFNTREMIFATIAMAGLGIMGGVGLLIGRKE